MNTNRGAIMSVDLDLRTTMEQLQESVDDTEAQLAQFSAAVRRKIGAGLLKASPDQQNVLHLLHEELTETEALLVKMRGKLEFLFGPLKTGVWPF